MRNFLKDFDLEDVLVAASVVAVVVGLFMIYRPLALIVPGMAILFWIAYRRRGPPER